MNTIITGATKGIGRALALKFASEGHSLALCARNKSDLIAFQQELENIHPSIKVLVFVADISQKNDIENFANESIKHFGHIDVLINNGGIFLPGATTEEAEGTLEKMINTNLYSAYHLTRAIVPHMSASAKPHIFNMCSIASTTAYPNGGSYSISKFALLGYTKVLRQELINKGIKVTAIMPGATWSDSWAGVELPYDRLMEAKDIAECVWSAYILGKSAVVEEIVIRPQLGDL